MQKENDTLLVAKLREGNKFAFEALYEKYSARLYNTIVHIHRIFLDSLCFCFQLVFYKFVV